MIKLEKIQKLAEKAETEVKEKRILSGMELFQLKKENYVIFSKEDYNELLNSLDNN